MARLQKDKQNEQSLPDVYWLVLNSTPHRVTSGKHCGFQGICSL
jgi:hypothetical protein